jgi:S1-C subfamily serine protease
MRTFLLLLALLLSSPIIALPSRASQPKSSASSGSMVAAQGDKAAGLYEEYLKRTTAQASKDSLIGIWSGSLCGKRIILAVVLNDDPREGNKLKAVLLNGKEVGYRFDNGDPWFYVSPAAVQGVYEGKTVYRNLLFKRWYPNRVVMSAENVFTAYDDVTMATCGPTTNIYVRKEPRPNAAPESPVAAGTGFLVVGSAFVITANHVVGRASTITVRFPNGDKYAAKVVGRDAKNDIAVLGLAGFVPSERGFSLGIQSPVSAGEIVHALGYPLSNVLGEQPSIVSGQVSSTTGLEDSPTEFRLTAPINPGNSGGPIINQYGDVVGITVATLRGRSVEGIGFGVKIGTAIPLLQQAGIKVDEKPRRETLSASQVFASRWRDVVLIEAK